MKTVIVTGGICSGKSFVSARLTELLNKQLHGSAELISFDKVIAALYEEQGSSLMADVRNLLGTSDKKEIATFIFKKENAAKLEALEKLFIPKALLEFERLVYGSGTEVTVIEFPLYYKYKDLLSFSPTCVIAVDAFDSEVKLRISKRPNPTAALEALAIQPSSEKFAALADVVVRNNHLLDEQLKKLISPLLASWKSFMDRPRKIGVVSGSFDPITRGHLWVIEQSLRLVDKLVIMTGPSSNPKKAYTFSIEDRISMINSSLKEVLTQEQLNRIVVYGGLDQEMLVTEAKNFGATHIFRGIRDFTDFNYEGMINMVQKQISPEIETVFLMPPRNLTEVSSSVVKSMIRYPEWKKLEDSYVTKSVAAKLNKFLGKN